MPAGGVKTRTKLTSSELERNLRYLSEASQTLASSLDYQTTLNKVAELAIPEIADWCTVDLLDERGQLQLVAVAHQDPKQVKWAKRLRQVQPIDLSSGQGVAEVLRTGQAQLYPIITDQMIRAAARTKKELRLIRKLGFVSVIIVPISSEKKVIGAITLVSTQPGHHYTSADLSMAQELASRAALAITNAQLYQEARTAIKLRDEFITIASHELKTPLTSMRMYTEVLQRRFAQSGDATTAEYLTELNQQITKLTKLIKDLLDISRLQHKDIPLNVKKFDITKLVREVIVTVQLLPQFREIRFNATTPIWIWADRDRLSQVILNLLTNAVKYSPSDRQVVVRVKHHQKVIQITVQDFGIGIAKKDQRNIFDRFFQIRDAGQVPYPGLGIGLYIANQITKHHQGTLTVKSRKGKGSTFIVRLPLKQTADKSR